MKARIGRVSTKGRILIPVQLREELGLVPGTPVSIQREGDVLILRPVTAAFVHSLRGYFRNSALGEFRERDHRTDKR
ncbi:MAG: AbrB/MazE/SpoVT family DNA-binding domain-containing protein [Candidatus Korobacteraceae bacterium]|jgi:AbrB family looped-hinge helix DNA binding protein